MFGVCGRRMCIAIMSIGRIGITIWYWFPPIVLRNLSCASTRVWARCLAIWSKAGCRIGMRLCSLWRVFRWKLGCMGSVDLAVFMRCWTCWGERVLMVGLVLGVLVVFEGIPEYPQRSISSATILVLVFFASMTFLTRKMYRAVRVLTASVLMMDARAMLCLFCGSRAVAMMYWHSWATKGWFRPRYVCP